MVAIAEACVGGEIPARVVLVASDRPGTVALERASALSLPTCALDYRGSSSPEAYHQELVARLREADVEVIALAGYMRILPADVIRAFPNRILNIHPSLLPSFPGLHPHEQAIRHGVKVSGCTVHLVDEGVDEGPILLQEAVPVADDDTAASLSARILAVEHKLYPHALGLMAGGCLTLHGRRIIREEQRTCTP